MQGSSIDCVAHKLMFRDVDLEVVRYIDNCKQSWNAYENDDCEWALSLSRKFEA